MISCIIKWKFETEQQLFNGGLLYLKCNQPNCKDTQLFFFLVSQKSNFLRNSLWKLSIQMLTSASALVPGIPEE